MATSTLLLNFLWGCGENTAPAPPTASTTPPSLVPPSQLTDPVEVLRVVDGDTIEIQKENQISRVRIKGINAPELQPEPEGSPAEAYANEARTFILRNIGPQVDLEFNSDCPQDTAWETCRDSYDRLLAYIKTADGGDIGAKLLSRGLAKVYRRAGGSVPPFDRENNYLALESEAQSQELGIWSD